MDKIFEKLDKITERLNTIDKTLVKQEENLKEHMRRSELAEEGIKTLKEELRPVQAHVMIVNFAFKIALTLLSVIGTVATVLHYWL